MNNFATIIPGPLFQAMLLSAEHPRATSVDNCSVNEKKERKKERKKRKEKKNKLKFYRENINENYTDCIQA